MGYERAKDHGRGEFNAPEALTIDDQDCALDVVDPTSKIHAQNTQVKLATDPWSQHLQDKITKELITYRNPHQYRYN